jgi:hypothetical protein
MKQRLSYTAKLAQAAGSLSALALLPAGAQAGIVYHNTVIGPLALPAGGFIPWDVDSGNPNNNGAEFQLYGSSSVGNEGFLSSYNLNARGLVQTAGQGGPVFQKLGLGFAVGPTLAAAYQWGNPGLGLRTILATFVGSGLGGAAQAGGFNGGGNERFGFRFTDSTGGLFYGWANLNIDLANRNFSISEWGYESCANTGIAVGATSGGASCSGAGGGGGAVPEPSTLSLALLGLGAGGVRAWRKRKQAQALAA